MCIKIENWHDYIHGQDVDVVLSGLSDLQLPAIDDVFEAESVEIGDTHDHEEMPDGDLFRKQVVNIP